MRNDIRSFKKANDLDTVVVLWTANTERYVDVRKGVTLFFCSLSLPFDVVKFNI